MEEDHAITNDSAFEQAIEELMLVEEAGEAFDNDALLSGDLTPVFFGSALANFGVQNFLNAYVDFAPMPNARQTKEDVEVSPFDDSFSGFIFENSSQVPDPNTARELPLCVSLVVHLNVVWMLLCNVLIKSKRSHVQRHLWQTIKKL